jgi:hypothetical protein
MFTVRRLVPESGRRTIRKLTTSPVRVMAHATERYVERVAREVGWLDAEEEVREAVTWARRAGARPRPVRRSDGKPSYQVVCVNRRGDVFRAVLESGPTGPLMNVVTVLSGASSVAP